MLLNEILEESANYVGNCVNSFDADGECLIRQLPWSDVTEFAQAVEDAWSLTKEQFTQNVNVHKDIDITKMEFSKTADDVYVAYDEHNDIHYFFK